MYRIRESIFKPENPRHVYPCLSVTGQAYEYTTRYSRTEYMRKDISRKSELHVRNLNRHLNWNYWGRLHLVEFFC